MSSPEPNPSADGPKRDLLPVILLVVVAAVLIAGWLLFPTIQAFVFMQDCTASGRTNCS